MKNELTFSQTANVEEYKNRGVLISRFKEDFKEQLTYHSAPNQSLYHLIYLTAGSGTLTVDFNEDDFVPGTFCILRPGQRNNWVFEENPTGYIVSFNEGYFKSFVINPFFLDNFSFLEGMSGNMKVILTDHAQSKILCLLEEILNEGRDPGFLDADLVRVLLINILIQISRTLKNKNIGQRGLYNQNLLKNFKKLVEANYLHHRFPKQYAELLYITPNHLNALCNDQLGISAGQIIRDRIILEAKRLLRDVKLTVTDVSEKLGFLDNSYFVKFFKKSEGTTPDKFRKIDY